MADLDIDLLPLEINSTPKKPPAVSISSTGISSKHSSRAIAAELQALNALISDMQSLDSPVGIPPPPMPVHPKRSAAILKMKDTGSDHFHRGNFSEADRLYSLALQMALTRPSWEPATLVRDEASLLLANRAQARMAEARWAEAAVDAEASAEAKRVGNTKAWWRRGTCLAEMGRWEEALEWVGRALELEGDESDLVALAERIEKAMGGKA